MTPPIPYEQGKLAYHLSSSSEAPIMGYLYTFYQNCVSASTRFGFSSLIGSSMSTHPMYGLLVPKPAKR
jgi:hypothetical protein